MLCLHVLERARRISLTRRVVLKLACFKTRGKDHSKTGYYNIITLLVLLLSRNVISKRLCVCVCRQDTCGTHTL